jgi:hypothetical protein
MNNKNKGVSYYEWFQQLFQIVVDVLDQIVFTDEPWLHLSRKLYQHSE